METDHNKDCLGCRIVSGSGLIGAAAYIAHQSKKSENKWGKLFMQAISLGFASVGTARLLNIYPFNVTHQNLKKTNDETNHSTHS